MLCLICMFNQIEFSEDFHIRKEQKSMLSSKEWLSWAVWIGLRWAVTRLEGKRVFFMILPPRRQEVVFRPQLCLLAGGLEASTLPLDVLLFSVGHSIMTSLFFRLEVHDVAPLLLSLTPSLRSPNVGKVLGSEVRLFLSSRDTELSVLSVLLCF